MLSIFALRDTLLSVKPPPLRRIIGLAAMVTKCFVKVAGTIIVSVC